MLTDSHRLLDYRSCSFGMYLRHHARKHLALEHKFSRPECKGNNRAAFISCSQHALVVDRLHIATGRRLQRAAFGYALGANSLDALFLFAGLSGTCVMLRQLSNCLTEIFDDARKNVIRLNCECDAVIVNDQVAEAYEHERHAREDCDLRDENACFALTGDHEGCQAV